MVQTRERVSITTRKGSRRSSIETCSNSVWARCGHGISRQKQTSVMMPSDLGLFSRRGRDRSGDLTLFIYEGAQFVKQPRPEGTGLFRSWLGTDNRTRGRDGAEGRRGDGWAGSVKVGRRPPGGATLTGPISVLSHDA
jgi:hypothetical protein